MPSSGVPGRSEADERPHAGVEPVADGPLGSLTAEDVGDWRRQVDVAHAHGEFLFCEPTFVVSARAN